MGINGLPADYNHEEYSDKFERQILEDDFYGNGDRSKGAKDFALKQINLLNKDQRAAFDEIREAICNNGEQKLFFIEGAGGCGN